MISNWLTISWLVHSKDCSWMVNCSHGLYSELQSLANNVNKFLQCLYKLVDNKKSKIFEFGLTNPFEVYIKENNQCYSQQVFLVWCSTALDGFWVRFSVIVLVFPRAYYFLCEEPYHRHIKTSSTLWDASKNKIVL